LLGDRSRYGAIQIQIPALHLGAPGILYPPKKTGATVFLTAESQDKPNAAPWNAAQIAGND
jgi:hypothetical protein